MSEKTFECDFCSAKVAEGLRIDHTAFKIETPVGLVDATAGAFAACPACAVWWEAADFRGLAAVAAALLKANDKTKRAYELMYAAIHLHQTGTSRVTAADKRAAAEWVDHDCPVCRFHLRIASASYDKGVGFRCPACGVKTAIISKEPGK